LVSSQTSSTSLLQIQGLRVAFGVGKERNEVIHGLDLQVMKGECLGIVGESGSGKSVTALSILRLLPRNGHIESGTIKLTTDRYPDTDIGKLSEKELRQIRGNEVAMIFQEPMSALNPVIKCGKQVVEAIRLHKRVSNKAAKATVQDWFREVDLPLKTFEAYPHELSGGQKQRVMIAMAMCCEPALLIADEPTTALDVTIQSKILDLLRRLQQSHDLGILFITHDLGVVAEIADRVLVMRNGEVLEENDVLSIFQDPQHPYTKGLLACRPTLDQQKDFLPTVADFETDSTENLPVDDSVIHVGGESDPDLATTKSERLAPLLRVEELRTWFSQRSRGWKRETCYVKAVDGVSLELFPGETLGLVGESGCGKTTLGRSILRLIPFTSGEVYYQQHGLHTLSHANMRALRREMQIIFQDPYSSLNPRMRIGEAIVEAMRVHHILASEKARRERVKELLSDVGLEPDHVSRYPHQFSGGQRQRICIARALSLNPSFIICDESVSALDVSVQAQVLNLLKRLQQERGISYLFISHDLSVVKHISDRIVVMRNGKVVETNTADKLYAHPQSDYTRQLIAAVPKGTPERILEIQSERSQA